MTSVCCVFLSLLFLQSAAGAPSDTPSADAVPEKYALLVGINRYGLLPESQWLEGCHNDIAEVKSVIVGRFAFPAENVTILLDEQATAAGIRAALATLVEQVQQRPNGSPPAQVLFYFSGHGSRVPDQPEGHPDCDSEDGFDSTLVVFDSTQQGSDTDIRDDELNRFAHEICRADKAELLLVLDSCHSGGGARSVGKTRGISRDFDRLASIDPAARKFTPKKLPESTVFLSACQANQKEPEYEADGKKFGLFSWHFARLLQSEELLSSLDYITLKELIHRSYLRSKIVQAPTPTIEGPMRMLKKPVLGAERTLDRKAFHEVAREGRERDVLRMEAGRIHGVTERSVYELFETAEQALAPEGVSLGWFRITHVEGNAARGLFFRWKDAQRSEAVDAVLPNGFKNGVALERYHDHGENFLAVRLVDAITGVVCDAGDQRVPAPMRAVLAGSGSRQESEWIRWVDASQPCDLVLKFDQEAGLAAVFPTSGGRDDADDTPKTRSADDFPETLRGGWGPVAWKTEQGAAHLTGLFRSIMRVVALKRLVAEKSPPPNASETDGGAKLSAAIFHHHANDALPRPVNKNAADGIVLDGGEDDWYEIHITNNDARPVYLTILCIDPDMLIESFPFGPRGNETQFDPAVGTDNNRHANQMLPGEEVISILGFAEPFGPHTLLFLATCEPGDFTYLSQPSAERTRSMTDDASQVLQFIHEQCAVGTRATVRPPVPRNDAWHVYSLEVTSRSAN